MPLKVQPGTLKTQPCSFLCSNKVLPCEWAMYFSRFSGSHSGVTVPASLPDCALLGAGIRGGGRESSVEPVFLGAY